MAGMQNFLERRRAHAGAAGRCGRPRGKENPQLNGLRRPFFITRSITSPGTSNLCKYSRAAAAPNVSFSAMPRWTTAAMRPSALEQNSRCLNWFIGFSRQ
jgi:hypothetical protein